MIFEIGDVVVCTGWDDLQRQNGSNILEFCGFKKYDKLSIIDIMDNLLIFDNSGNLYTNKVCLESKHFTLVSTIRNNKLLKVLK